MAREGGPREGEGGRGSYIFSEVLRRRGHRITTIAYRFVHLCVLVQLLGADVGPEGDQLADVLRTHFTKVSPTTCLQRSSLPGYRARARKHT